MTVETRIVRSAADNRSQLCERQPGFAVRRLMESSVMAEQDADLQWHPTCAGTAARYDDIWFADPQVGWAVNSNGQIVNTTDGGVRWTTQLQLDPLPGEGGPPWMRCIRFVTPQRGSP